MKAIGVSSGIWSSIVSFVLVKIYTKLKKEADSKAAIEDQKKIDDELNKKHQEQLNNPNTTEQELIETETDILNGGRKP